MVWELKANIKGPQGDQGPVGPAGPAGLEWQGPWDDVVQYAPDDSVGWGGSTYFALDPAPDVGVPPTGVVGDPGANDAAVNAGWQVLSLEGAQGPQGPQGDQGDPGIQGPQGDRGSKWFVGQGAPGVIADSQPGDMYLDQDTGDIYDLV